eukprot:4000163-Pyramimonas_sp.AAC.1
MALYCTSGALTYATDCDMVAEGWYYKKYIAPRGEDADIWWEVGKLVRGRAITVLFTHSHLTAQELCDGKGA